MHTLVITKHDVTKLIDIEALKTELTEGFKKYSGGADGRIGQRIILDLGSGNKTTVLGPGVSEGIPAYTVKTNSKFPGAQPAIKGVIALFDINDGQLLALLDSSSVTAIRTGLCAALATDFLSPENAKNVGIIGAGKQNELQLAYLLGLRDLTKTFIYDVKRSNAEKFADQFRNKIECEIVGSVAECVANTGIVLTATWTRTPILNKSHIASPCHITSLGADEKGKVELSEDLVRNSKFYCDDIDLNMTMGTPGNLNLTQDVIHAELGAALVNPELGRKDDGENTIYSNVGLPFQDLITAWHVYKKALDDKNILRTRMI